MPPERARLVAASGVACLLATGVPFARGAGERPLPYRLAVAVVWGASPGPESLRDEVARELIAGLRTAACFAAVDSSRTTGDGTDLELQLMLADVASELDYAVPISARAGAEPGVEQHVAARLEAVVALELLLLPERSVLRSKRWRQSVLGRASPGVDPKLEASRELVAALAREARLVACRGSREEWRRRIARTRAAARPPD